MQAGREEHERRREAEDDEGELDPDVAANAIAADREPEAHGREDERRRSAQRALEDDGAGDGPSRAGMAAGRLVDPRRVAAERGREHLRRGVGDEGRPYEPAEALVHAARGEELLPAPRERPDGGDPDRAGGEPPADARMREDVSRLAQVDPPEDVGGREAGDCERRGDAHGPGARMAHAAPVTRTFKPRRV